MKILHKIAPLLTAVLIATSAVSATVASATETQDPGQWSSAPNTTDVVWSGTVDWSRRKNNNTSVYVKNASLYNSATISVYGANYSNPSGNISVSHNIYDYSQYHQTVGLTLPATYEREIYQFIRENGCYYAHIYFSGQASGRWSPDCAGSYDVLNP